MYYLPPWTMLKQTHICWSQINKLNIFDGIWSWLVWNNFVVKKRGRWDIFRFFSFSKVYLILDFIFIYNRCMSQSSDSSNTISVVSGLKKKSVKISSGHLATDYHKALQINTRFLLNVSNTIFLIVSKCLQISYYIFCNFIWQCTFLSNRHSHRQDTGDICF